MCFLGHGKVADQLVALPAVTLEKIHLFYPFCHWIAAGGREICGGKDALRNSKLEIRRRESRIFIMFALSLQDSDGKKGNIWPPPPPP